MMLRSVGHPNAEGMVVGGEGDFARCRDCIMCPGMRTYTYPLAVATWRQIQNSDNLKRISMTFRVFVCHKMAIAPTCMMRCCSGPCCSGRCCSGRRRRPSVAGLTASWFCNTLSASTEGSDCRRSVGRGRTPKSDHGCCSFESEGFGQTHASNFVTKNVLQPAFYCWLRAAQARHRWQVAGPSQDDQVSYSTTRWQAVLLPGRHKSSQR